MTLARWAVGDGIGWFDAVGHLCSCRRDP